MNKVFLIGNLTRDPELRTTPAGKAVCNFSLAVNRRAQGDRPEADYFRVTVWDALAESCGKYLAKGKKAAVAGSVHLDTYTDRDGVSRSGLAVGEVTQVEFLTPKQADPGNPRVPDEELPDFGGR